MNSTTPQGPRYRQLPLWRDATRLLVAVETAVRRCGGILPPEDEILAGILAQEEVLA